MLIDRLNPSKRTTEQDEMIATYRKYNVMVKNTETGQIVQMNTSPVTHSEGCVMLSKIVNHSWRRKYLKEVSE